MKCLHELLDLALEAREKGLIGSIDFGTHVDVVSIRFYKDEFFEEVIFSQNSYYKGSLKETSNEEVGLYTLPKLLENFKQFVNG